MSDSPELRRTIRDALSFFEVQIAVKKPPPGGGGEEDGGHIFRQSVGVGTSWSSLGGELSETQSVSRSFPGGKTS